MLESKPHTSPDKLRIALLMPSVELGAYWRPVLYELKQLTQQVKLYTARTWPGFDPHDPQIDSTVEVVGEMVRITSNEQKTDYSGGYMKLSPQIVGRLLEFKPQAILASGFSFWTILALLFKPLGGWRVILVWESSAPSIDFRNSKLRLLQRRIVASFADSFITNSRGGAAYLSEFVGVAPDRIQVRPYLVPDPYTLLRTSDRAPGTEDLHLQSPVFLFVGRIEERKGIHLLLQACNILHQQGCKFSLLIAGGGPKLDELKAYCQANDLEDCVRWLGWVDYTQLGVYFRQADIFVFPSLEDTWGMVVMEAMSFGKPVICSKWAGAYELIEAGKNGFICDPHDPIAMAALMRKSIDRPETIAPMGQAAKATMAPHTPIASATFLTEVSLKAIDR